MAEWRKEAKHQDLADAIARSETRAGAGSFNGLAFNENLILLDGMLALNDSIPQIDRRRLITEGIDAASRAQALTAAGLLRHISGREAEYLRQPLRKFHLLTAVSIAGAASIPRYRLRGASISFGGRTGGTAQKARSRLVRDARHSIVADPPTTYMPVVATIEARTPSEAGTRALDAVDLVRSLWNLALNRRKHWRRSFARGAPVNEVFLAPIHSVHEPGGALASDSWWFDPAYIGPAPLLSDQAKVSSMLAFTAKARRYRAKLRYAAAWEGAALRYGRALDSHDLSDAFLRLWGVLETLTESTSAPAAVTIKRSAFLFSDRDRANMVLSHLAGFRNRFVHFGAESDEIEGLLFLLKRYVEAMLIFHLEFPHRFTSVGEACEFLDLPSTKQAIAKRLRLLKLASKFVVAR